MKTRNFCLALAAAASLAPASSAQETAPQASDPAAVQPAEASPFAERFAAFAESENPERARLLAEMVPFAGSSEGAFLGEVALNSDSYQERLAAMELLAAIGSRAGEQAGHALAEVASQAKRQSSERREAVRSLKAMLWAPAAPALVDILRERRDAALIELASEALAGIGAPAVPALAEALAGEGSGLFRERAARTLGMVGPAAAPALPELVASLERSPRNVQQVSRYLTAGRALTEEEIKGAVYEAFDVRAEAARALGKIGPGASEAVPALIAAFEDSLEEEMAVAAAEALAGIGGPAAAEALPSLRAKAGRFAPSADVAIGEAIRAIESQLASE